METYEEFSTCRTVGVASHGGFPVAKKSTRIFYERPTPLEKLKKEGSLLALCSIVLGLSIYIPALKSRGLWLTIPCWFNKLTGVPCLACGMTRSFSLTAHGQIAQALQMHLLGPVAFFCVCLVSIYLAVCLVTGLRLKLVVSPVTRKTVMWAVFGVFLACWVFKIFFMRQSW